MAESGSHKSHLNAEAKQLVCQVYEWCLENNLPFKSFCNFCKDRKISFDKSTAYRWIAAERESEKDATTGETRGRPSALTTEEEFILLGYPFFFFCSSPPFHLSLCSIVPLYT